MVCLCEGTFFLYLLLGEVMFVCLVEVKWCLYVQYVLFIEELMCLCSCCGSGRCVCLYVRNYVCMQFVER